MRRHRVEQSEGQLQNYQSVSHPLLQTLQPHTLLHARFLLKTHLEEIIALELG
jgi:hypothetical protein